MRPGAFGRHLSPASWPGALWWALHLKALPVHPAPVNKKPRPHLATDCTCSPGLSTNRYSSGSGGSSSSNLRTAQVWRSNLVSVCDFNHKQKAQTEGKLLCRQHSTRKVGRQIRTKPAGSRYICGFPGPVQCMESKRITATDHTHLTPKRIINQLPVMEIP